LSSSAQAVSLSRVAGEGWGEGGRKKTAKREVGSAWVRRLGLGISLSRCAGEGGRKKTVKRELGRAWFRRLGLGITLSRTAGEGRGEGGRS
jgi:hypothetical protein